MDNHQYQAERELSANRIFIDGLPGHVSKAQFSSLVSPFGKIKDLVFTPTGKGIVEFETNEGAQYAILGLNKATKFDCELYVGYAHVRLPKEERAQHPRSKPQNPRPQQGGQDQQPKAQTQAHANGSAQKEGQDKPPRARNQKRRQQGENAHQQQPEDDEGGVWIDVSKKGKGKPATSHSSNGFAHHNNHKQQNGGNTRQHQNNHQSNKSAEHSNGRSSPAQSQAAPAKSQAAPVASAPAFTTAAPATVAATPAATSNGAPANGEFVPLTKVQKRKQNKAKAAGQAQPAATTSSGPAAAPTAAAAVKAAILAAPTTGSTIKAASSDAIEILVRNATTKESEVVARVTGTTVQIVNPQLVKQYLALVASQAK